MVRSYRITYALVFIFLTFSHFSAWSKQITAGFPEFPPYTFTENNKPSGIGIEMLQKLNTSLELDIELVPVNTYGNGIRRLKQHKIDFFLLATQNSDRDKLAQFSEPLVINRWSWFSLKGNVFEYNTPKSRSELRVATYDHSNTHKWLLSQHFIHIYATTDISAMLRQLKNGRIDAIFLSEQVLLETLKQSETPLDDLSVTLQVARPMGIYVNHKWLEQHPNFMPKLNKAIVSHTKQQH